MSPPPSLEPEFQASRSSEESEQLRNLMDIVPRLESRVKSLEKELSETKQTLGTTIFQLIEKVKKLENKLRKKRKSKEAKDAEGQDQEVPFETDQGDTFVTPEKSKGSGEAQEEQITLINTGEVMLLEVNTDIQKSFKELRNFREAKRVQAVMDVETHRQIDLDALLARDLERAKFLHDTIAAQRKFLAEQRSAIIRNKPPTISQLRNQMITYLKHVANKKHAELKSKSFEEIQVLYERYKKQDQTFVAIGSEEDERAIKRLMCYDADKEEEKKDESVHEEVQGKRSKEKEVRHKEEVKSKKEKAWL
ncbi:hypothetical protein Tco_1079730 [Tanacetum coccineum]|uniref:Uncharacterized protein n=1 Tax=Tanacetum coccineum TaxID=301880 RepID=A0ABQ5HU61_9ASTR